MIRPSIFPPDIVAGLSTRVGGVSRPPLGMNLSFKVGDHPEHVVRNRAIFFGGLGLTLDRLAIPGQVHGADVRHARAPGEYPDCDALISNVPNVFLCVSTADCVPILLFDPVRRAVGAVHAGWRGTVAEIIPAAVRAMATELGTTPGDVLAHIGPSAGPCCYEVGEEVASQFSPAFVVRRDDTPFADLKRAVHRQLLDAGLVPGRIETSPFCTISDSSLFHSHRRDGAGSGRMMGVIGLTT